MRGVQPSKNSQVLTGGQDNRAFLFDYNHPEQKRELAGHTVAAPPRTDA